MSENNIHKKNIHTRDFDKVLRAERAYIEKRRKRVHLKEEEKSEGLWGVAFSNGGARASTLMLGVLRRLMAADFFRRIDYLSTTGGSSFMAAAFAALLTGEKSTDKRGLFGTRPHNSPFLPGSNEAGHGKGVTPEMQMEHLRKQMKDIKPHFWKNIGGAKGLFGISTSGFVYALLVFLLILTGWMALHHLYFYWISQYSGNLFQTFIDQYETPPLPLWSGVQDAFYFVEGLKEMFRNVVMASNTPGGWLVGGVVALVGAVLSLGFFLLYLRPALKNQRLQDVHIEVKVKQFYYFGFGLTYLTLLVLGLGIHFNPDVDYRLAFSLPIFLTFGILISGFLYGFATRLQYVGDDNRRALTAEISTVGFWMFLAALGFPVLLITLLLIGGWATFFFSLISFFIAIRLIFRRIKKLGSIKALRWYGNFPPNFFIGFSIILLFASMGKLTFNLAKTDGGYSFWWFVACVAVPGILLYLFSLFGKRNKESLHSYFKDKKSEIFLITEERNGAYQARNDAQLRLKNLGEKNFYAPYLLFNAALNVHTSASPNTRRRRAVPFIFSKYYVGSEKTGYVKTKDYADGKMTLSDAMMTAASNHHSGMGIHGFYGQAFLFTLLNLRLGKWLPNPWYYRPNTVTHSRGSSKFINFLREYVNRFSTRALHINVSSGIHTGDHWGLTALLKRECRNIVICDFRSPYDLIPTEKKTLNITDIRAIAAQNRAYIGDAETSVLESSGEDGLCKSNIITCTLTYENGVQGRFYYIKLAMSEALPDSILEYQQSHPKFPFEFASNLQQPDLQFNSFVHLGESMAAQFLQSFKENEVSDMDKMLAHRIEQINMQEKLHQMDIEGLLKQEEALIKKLNAFREQYFITSDFAEKYELGIDIEKIEDELTTIRTEVAEKQADSLTGDS